MDQKSVSSYIGDEYNKKHQRGVLRLLNGHIKHGIFWVVRQMFE